MSTGNFISTIESALGPVREGIMRNVTPQALAKNPRALKYLQTLKARGMANPMVIAALQAYQAYQIAAMGDEGRQAIMDDAYENPDDKNILETVAGSLLNAPRTLYTAGRAMSDMSGSVAGELESKKALGEAEKKAAEKAGSRSKKKKDTPSEDKELTESDKALLFELGVGDGVAEEKSLSDYEKEDMQKGAIDEVSEEKSLSDYEKEDMQKGAIDEAVSELGEEVAAKIPDALPAEPEVDYSDKAIELFKNTHGTDFDSKSSMDKGKLEDMKVTLADNKGKDMTPNQFALKYYRQHVL